MVHWENPIQFFGWIPTKFQLNKVSRNLIWHPGTPLLQPVDFRRSTQRLGPTLINRKWLIGFAVVLIMLIVPCMCIGIVGGYGFLTTVNSEPEDITIDLYFPSGNGRVGESDPFEFHIVNTSDQAQILDSIDISSVILEGINIRGSDPAYNRLETFFDWDSFYFERVIAPGEALVVKFDAVATNGGDFSGWIDVCINSASNCLRFEGEISIASSSG